MAAKKRSTPEESRTTAEYYKLHTGAVRNLVEADASNSPEVSEEELRKYRSGPKLQLSNWAKALLIKAWFAGSVCFFILWGLSSYVADTLDLMVIFAIALGVITDIITNNILRYYAKSANANDRWMMFPEKRFYTFFLNILYAGVLLFLTQGLYALINAVLSRLGWGTLGVGPILFGLFYTAFDLLLITVKRTFRQIFADALKSAERK